MMLRIFAKCAFRLLPIKFQRLSRATFSPRAGLATLIPPSTPPALKLKLRDYQQDCIQSVIDSLRQGHKRLGISLATGSGKTVIFTQLIDQVPPRSLGSDRTLILTHRRELVEQAARHCTLAYPSKTIDVEMGSLHASGAADITVASLQSIISKDRLDKFDPSAYKLVLVDEAHHIVAPGYLRTLKHFGLDEKRDESPALVGVSATFSRFDGVKLGAVIDEIVYHKDYVDMINDKWLSDVVFTTVTSSAKLPKMKGNLGGDFQTGELSKVVNTDQVNDLTVKSWITKAIGRRSTLVFCVDLAHVAGLTDKFRRYGYDARSVTSETPKVERSNTLDAFKRGEFPVLVNCGVFTEGTDIPNVDCVVLARPTRSRNLLVQMIGRGMRLHPGKKDCHVIDLVSSLETGIVTTPTLFGLDPAELVEEASASDMRSLKERQQEPPQDQQQQQQQQQTSPHPNEAPPPESQYPTSSDTPSNSNPDPNSANKSVTFTDYTSILDLITDTTGEKHIRSLSPYAWVQVGPDRFVLAAPNGSYIRIEHANNPSTTSTSTPTSNPTDPKYRAVLVRALPPPPSSKRQKQQPQQQFRKSPFAAPREILTALTFTDAVHGADSYAAENFPHTFIFRQQRWRLEPPTEGQLAFLDRLRGDDPPPANLNKGRVADIITRLKHGARGRFTKLGVEKRSREKKSQIAEARQSREQVRVGPLAA